jgi:hypothetical protein
MSTNDPALSLLHTKISNLQEGLLLSYLEEFVKLKDEQIQRMHFRDNLLYITLGALGGIMSYVVIDPSRYYLFLVIPWVCLILGWAYLTNDEKISAIGEYIRNTLTNKVGELVKVEPKTASLFGWEVAHRKGRWRLSRKIFQLIIDEITFFISGLASLKFFWSLEPNISQNVLILSLFEFVLLGALGIWIGLYADLKTDRSPNSPSP